MLPSLDGGSFHGWLPLGLHQLLLVLLLLWVVREPLGPHWRIRLGVAVINSRTNGGVVILDSRLAGEVVILISRLPVVLYLDG